MEEVVGSIPTRSTNSLKGLAPIAILRRSNLPVCRVVVLEMRVLKRETQKEGAEVPGQV